MVTERKARKVISKITQTRESLRSAHLQSLHSLAYYCCQPLSDHWLKLLLPSQSAALGVAHDGAMDSVLGVTLVDGLLDDPRSMKRLRLPARIKGIGIRACGDSRAHGISPKRFAAFLGAVNQFLPRCLDTVSLEGGVVAGFAPGLAPRIGAGSFDEVEAGGLVFLSYL